MSRSALRIASGFPLLALGVVFAACAPISTQSAYNSSTQTAYNAPSTAPSSAFPASRTSVFPSNAPIDAGQSRALTDYLHNQHLPLVGARVLASNGGPRQVILYGFVATAFGKADAADQVRVFTNDPGAEIDNRIEIAPQLANRSVKAPPAGAQSNSDVQDYENQQALAQQQLQQYQQYQQGSSGVTTMMPLLGLFSSFGSFGGGGMGYGFGGAPFGPGFGPFGPYPAYPPAGFGAPLPYSPIFP